MSGIINQGRDLRKFLTFMLVGGIAALANWSSRISLSAAGLQLSGSIFLAYIVGMATAYILIKFFVFERSGRALHDEAGRFVAVNLIGLVQVWTVTVSLERWALPAAGWIWYPYEVAHAVGVASPILTSYFGHQYFSFSKKAEKQAQTKTREGRY